MKKRPSVMNHKKLILGIIIILLLTFGVFFSVMNNDIKIIVLTIIMAVVLIYNYFRINQIITNEEYVKLIGTCTTIQTKKNILGSYKVVQVIDDKYTEYKVILDSKQKIKIGNKYIFYLPNGVELQNEITNCIAIEKFEQEKED